MLTVHVFNSGDNQSIRLPKEFCLTTREVEIFRREDEIILREHKVSAVEIFNILTSFPDDFMADEERIDTQPQERKSL